MSSTKKGKILFIPMNSHGHVNYCAPIASRFLELYGDQNEVYFVLNQEYTEKVKKMSPNSKFITYEDPAEKQFTGNMMVEVMQKFGATWSEDRVSYAQSSAPLLGMQLQSLIDLYPKMTEIIEEQKPDLIIFDQIMPPAFGKDKNIPWANLISAGMNFVAYEKFPPPQSGLPSEYTPENVKKWEDFIEKAYKVGPFLELKKKCSENLKEHGLKGLDDQYFLSDNSPYLNIYAYPKELDFQEEQERKMPGNWIRIESPVVKKFVPAPLPVPEKLKNKPGKLIYFSFGSMASIYKPLMQKMLSILEQLPHRFIVSTGVLGDEFEMKDNMYGEKWLNQFAVLQTVDMTISHGGNNTLTESFFFGKPLIFVPLFGDQPDNAQRMHDKGLGRRCNIFDPPTKLKKDLEDAIEYCSQQSVVLKMKKASERIQNDSGLDQICEELIKLVRK